MSERGWGSISPYRRTKFRVRISIAHERVERILPSEPLAKATLKALRQRKVEVESGIATPRGMAEDVRVKDLIPDVLAAMKAGTRHVYSATTLRTYGIELARLEQSPIAGRRIATLRERDVAELAGWLRDGGAGTSHVRHVLDRLAQVIRFAVESAYISKAPVAIRRPRYNRNTAVWCPSEAELRKLIRAATAAYDKRALAIVLIAADAGLRIGEIANLRVRDVDLAAGVFHVESRGEQTDRTKTASRRVVPMLTSRVRRAVERLARNRDAEAPLFAVRDKDALSDVAGRAWRDVFGFEPRWHGLRRRFATWRALDGEPVPVIQAWLGHRLIETTMGYVKIPDERLRRGAVKGRQ